MTNTPNQPGYQSAPTRRVKTAETKASFKTSELYIYIVVALAVLIAAAVTDNGDDGQGFGAEQAWWYVTLLTVGYLISRGLAKAGSRARNEDD
jgi:hypothetical protein